MKKKFLFITFILTSFVLLAQNNDEYKSKGYFSLNKISYHFVNNISEDTFIPNQGGYTTHLDINNAYAFSINSINGWFVFPWLSAGIGVGYEYQNTMNFHLIPVYFDLRTYLSKSKNAIYLFADYGFISGINKNVGTGEMLNIGIGYKFFIKNYCFIAGLDFNSYTLLEVSGYPEPDPVHDFSVSSTAISIGIIF